MQNPPYQGHTSDDGFFQNLLHLKNLTIKWAKEKLQRDSHTLTFAESSLPHLMDNHNKDS